MITYLLLSDRDHSFLLKSAVTSCHRLSFSSRLICSRHIATTPAATPMNTPAANAAHIICPSPFAFPEYSRLCVILCMRKEIYTFFRRFFQKIIHVKHPELPHRLSRNISVLLHFLEYCLKIRSSDLLMRPPYASPPHRRLQSTPDRRAHERSYSYTMKSSL